MLQVKPSENGKNYGFGGFTTLELTEDGNGIGAININVLNNSHELYIYGINCSDELLADFLVRSAAAYGDNRYCYDIICLDTENQNVYKKLGFSLENGKFTLPISKIVHKSSN